MQEKSYDLVIIGGGITGAGIALDAITRGLSVALVDMQDFAAGTSSRSTKLVHGGLRYLKQFQVGVVAEVGKERAIVYENGPHVTTPEWMLLPFHKGGTFGKHSTSLGLRVYDFLAGVKKQERRKMLTPEQTLQREPLIKKDNLKGGGYYVEYRTDDARLTIEVMKRAVEHGADVMNYVKANRFLYEKKKVKGIEVTDRITGETFTLKGRVIVNAAGPWVDNVRDLDYSKNEKTLQLTKGVHLVIDQSVFPLQQAVYFDTADGRMIFAIPRDRKTYIGTTDTFYGNEKDTATPRMLEADRTYILDAIHYMFSDVTITEHDVESSWAGVRPLIFEGGKNPSDISRKDEVWEHDSGLVTIAGGKLTGYRKMAEHVVDIASSRVQKKTKKKFSSSKTEHLPISGADFGGAKQFERFIREKGEEALEYGLSTQEGRRLARFYGTNVDHVFRLAHAASGLELSGSLTPSIYAQVVYAIQAEMVVKPIDFFIRRTGALYFNIGWVREHKTSVLHLMQNLLGWTQEEFQQYERELDKEILLAVVPYDRVEAPKE
ncbi:glycerol-3-phosphate dehydrogenase/oxidase [Aureibacillus halotolerans]|nr:glycerol-3-phosphate dehydrogenase/oxidase [Aureibacillus halotolerans]